MVFLAVDIDFCSFLFKIIKQKSKIVFSFAILGKLFMGIHVLYRSKYVMPRQKVKIGERFQGKKSKENQ